MSCAAYILVSGRLEVRRYVNQFGHMESDEAPIDTPGNLLLSYFSLHGIKSAQQMNLENDITKCEL